MNDKIKRESGSAFIRYLAHNTEQMLDSGEFEAASQSLRMALLYAEIAKIETLERIAKALEESNISGATKL